MTQQTDGAPLDVVVHEPAKKTLNDALLELPIVLLKALFAALAWIVGQVCVQGWRLIRWAAPRYPAFDVLAYTVAWIYADIFIGVAWRADVPWWVNAALVLANPVPASTAFLTWWYWNDHAPETMNDYVAVWRSDIAGTLTDDDGLEEWARG